MKTFIVFLTLLVVGCCGGCATVDQTEFDPAPALTVDHNGDTPREALVRTWFTNELHRINTKRDVVDDMFKTGQLGYEEYFLLLEECDNEKRTILQRLPPEYRQPKRQTENSKDAIICARLKEPLND